MYSRVLLAMIGSWLLYACGANNKHTLGSPSEFSPQGTNLSLSPSIREASLLVSQIFTTNPKPMHLLSGAGPVHKKILSLLEDRALEDFLSSDGRHYLGHRGEPKIHLSITRDPIAGWLALEYRDLRTKPVYVRAIRLQQGEVHLLLAQDHFPSPQAVRLNMIYSKHESASWIEDYHSGIQWQHQCLGLGRCAGLERYTQGQPLLFEQLQQPEHIRLSPQLSINNLQDFYEKL